MICRICGAQIDDNAKFCTNCGAKLEDAVQPANTAPVPSAAAYAAGQTGSQYAPAGTGTANRPEPGLVNRQGGAGRYILKRLIFCGVAAAVWIIAAIVLGLPVKQAPVAAPGRIASFPERILMTLMITAAAFIAAFVVSSITGLAKGNKARNIFRIISAVLRIFVPFVSGCLFALIFALRLKLLPLNGTTSPVSFIMPFFSVFLPLTGFMMNAAQVNGRRDGLIGSIGAVAAWAADKMPLILIAEMITENVFSVPGLGTLGLQAFYMMDYSVLGAAFIILAVITCILRLLMDVIAALCMRGDPSGLVFARVDKRDHSGKALLIAGIAAAAAVLIVAAVIPLLGSGDPAIMNMNDMLKKPGENGYILGTDHFGRDFFTQLTLGLRNTVITSLVNTLIAVILGAIFGVLAGMIRGKAAEVFNGIAYVFGHGTGIAIIFLLFSGNIGTAMGFAAVGLFAWGGIADRVSHGIRTKRGRAGTVIVIPVLEQIVYTFCASAIWTTALAYAGLSGMNPGFPTLGGLIAQNRVYMADAAYLYVWPAVIFGLLLLAFWILHAGLCARERYSGK